MKKPALILGLWLVMLPLWADNDKPIAWEELPKQAQKTVKEKFADKQIALLQIESSLFDKDYHVIFKDGSRIEFSRSGDWTNIDCKKDAVPIDFIPSKIMTYLKANYPNAKVVSIEREKKTLEVELSNGMQFKFDKKFRIIDVDSD